MKTVIATEFLAPKSKDLASMSTLNDLDASGKELKKELRRVRVELGKFQNTLYAHGKYSVLVCLQGTDTAGKDSLIREVFKDFNVRGIVVHSFKVPTEIELQHDYLWRHYIALPARGKFGVFNRTHYENVLVTRVHPEYILNENIPGISGVDDINTAFWEARFDQIRNFERHIAQNGTIIFKFFLHLSKEEQRKRLLRRIRLKEKNWKFSPGDLKERKLWQSYQHCFQEAISETTLPHAPWYVIPADNKDAARVIVASILQESLKKYKDVSEPELNDEIKANIEQYKKELEKEEK
jgi:PPK2 family polyphosphate:nucleotide phosphotransferase